MPITPYAEKALLDDFFGLATYTNSATNYLGLLLTLPAYDVGPAAGVEVSGAGYARITVTLQRVVGVEPNWQSWQVNGQPQFATALAPWGTVRGLGLWDSPSGGHLIWWEPLIPAQSVGTGQSFVVPAGGFSTTLATANVTVTGEYWLLSKLWKTNTLFGTVGALRYALFSSSMPTYDQSGPLTLGPTYPANSVPLAGGGEVSGGGYARQAAIGPATNTGTPVGEAGWVAPFTLYSLPIHDYPQATSDWFGIQAIGMIDGQGNLLLWAPVGPGLFVANGNLLTNVTLNLQIT